MTNRSVDKPLDNLWITSLCLWVTLCTACGYRLVPCVRTAHDLSTSNSQSVRQRKFHRRADHEPIPSEPERDARGCRQVPAAKSQQWIESTTRFTVRLR